MLTSEREFVRPSDMTVLPNGRIVVRDDLGLQIFDEEGVFIKQIHLQGHKLLNGVCYAIKCDSNGFLITIHTNPKGEYNCITEPGETDILIIDIERSVVLEKVELVQILKDKKRSKCRFLECTGDMIYVVDLGLNQIYVINRLTSKVRQIGQPGSGPGQFQDAAGVAVDSAGNVIVSDAGNNRLQVFDRRRNFLGFISLNGQIARPSGIYLDRISKHLYILNLKSNSLTKVSFTHPNEYQLAAQMCTEV